MCILHFCTQQQISFWWVFGPPCQSQTPISSGFSAPLLPHSPVPSKLVCSHTPTWTTPTWADWAPGSLGGLGPWWRLIYPLVNPQSKLASVLHKTEQDLGCYASILAIPLCRKEMLFQNCNARTQWEMESCPSFPW